MSFDVDRFRAIVNARLAELGTNLNAIARESRTCKSDLYRVMRAPNPSARNVGVMLGALGLPWAALDAEPASRNFRV